MCTAVVDLLNRSNNKGKIDKHTLKELQTTGQLLYDSLLTVRVKEKLAATKTEHLIVSVDDRLVHIPWELLFDGNSFLCQRFNMGRVVSTSQRISEPSVRKIQKPLRMLIIADPRSDLEASYHEGVGLRNELDNNREIIGVHLRSSLVDVKYIKGVLRDFDIVHYAGHADYDIKNPSNSGFLMEDGKLKASDIINMIGPAPLPALVFSNACKSGHTDMWRVGEYYETEIYGLANAFLLAGVQHYIGTFWDVQDEPSLHFALDFYRGLMDGKMVGEAIRKARMHLIERYGEDTVIWASYMLYGDPTVRYVDLLVPEEMGEIGESIEREDADREEEKVMRGGVRGVEEVVAFPSNKQKWIIIGSAFLLVLAILYTFSIFKTDKGIHPIQKPVEVSKESPEAKKKRIDELVASLIENYKESQKTGGKEIVDTLKTGLPTLVFLNIKAYGMTEAEKEYIFLRVADNLQNSKRVQVVEREVIDRLLEELKLSSSQLADPATALKIGRILSARIISTGSIVREDRDWLVSLRFIETETTSIKAALTESLKTKDKEVVAERLGTDILKKIKAEYPLQGKILSLEGEDAVLNIGHKDGVTEGMKMKIFSIKDRIKVGEIEIASVDENTSHAKITSHIGELIEGLNVEELL